MTEAFRMAVRTNTESVGPHCQMGYDYNSERFRADLKMVQETVVLNQLC